MKTTTNQAIAKYRRFGIRSLNRVERRLVKCFNMRQRKAKSKEDTIAEGWTPEPKMKRTHIIELGVRYVGGEEECWVPLKSVRDASRRLRLILKFCQ